MVRGLWGNHKTENCVELVAKFVKTYSEMSLSVRMLDAHLDQLKQNMDASKEHGKCFRQDLLNFEHRYQGQYNDD